MRWVVFVFSAGLPAALSCGGSGPAGPSSTGLSRFSGAWSGTATATQMGACTFTGGPRAVTMDWTVTDSGELTIDERQSRVRWVGSITGDLSVSATKLDTAMCSGSSRTFGATSSGTIRPSNATHTVELEAIETPCPPDCVFRVVYSLTKQ